MASVVCPRASGMRIPIGVGRPASTDPAKAEMSNEASEPEDTRWWQPYRPSAFWRFFIKYADRFSLVWSIGAVAFGLVFIVLGIVLQATDAPRAPGNPPHLALIPLGIGAMAAGVGVRIWTRHVLSCGIEVSPVGIRITRVVGEPLILRWDELVGFEAEVGPIRQPALLVHVDDGESIRTYLPPAQLQTPWRQLRQLTRRPWEVFLWPWKVPEAMMPPAGAAAAHLQEELRRARQGGPEAGEMG